jgi:hypothetical protein
MAKKRGGLAGIYDRNKKVIKTLAPIAAGFIPGVGPLVGAALGAAMGGDREGKGYFKGFNAKGAALGGVSGYAGGKLGQAGKGLFTGGDAAAAGAKGLAQGTKTMNQGLSMIPSTAASAPASAAIPSLIPAASTAADVGEGMGAFGKVKDLFGNASTFVDKNKTILSGVGKGIMGIRQGDLDQQAADATLNQRKYEFDKTYGLDAAQEADRKRREDEIMAQRAAFRTMFTGTA